MTFSAIIKLKHAFITASLAAIAISLFGFVLFLSDKLPTDKAEKQKNNTASITIDGFVLDNNAPVLNYIAKLKNSSNQVIAIHSSLNTNRVQFQNIPTPVEKENPNYIPEKMYLEQNYPNPFNPSTKINFGVAKEGTVSLKIYDITGGLVKTIVDDNLQIGNYTATWMGETNNNQPASSGVYISVLEQNGNRIASKMVDLGGSSGTSTFSSNGSYTPEKETSKSLHKEQSIDYVIEISGTDSTRPLIDTKTIALTLQGDTAFAVYLDRFLKPATLNNINNVSMNEDEQPTVSSTL